MRIRRTSCWSSASRDWLRRISHSERQRSFSRSFGTIGFLHSFVLFFFTLPLLLLSSLSLLLYSTLLFCFASASAFLLFCSCSLFLFCCSSRSLSSLLSCSSVYTSLPLAFLSHLLRLSDWGIKKEFLLAQSVLEDNNTRSLRVVLELSDDDDQLAQKRRQTLIEGTTLRGKSARVAIAEAPVPVRKDGKRRREKMRFREEGSSSGLLSHLFLFHLASRSDSCQSAQRKQHFHAIRSCCPNNHLRTSW